MAGMTIVLGFCKFDGTPANVHVAGNNTFNVNVRGTLFTVQKALPLMRDGGSDPGRRASEETVRHFCQLRRKCSLASFIVGARPLVVMPRSGLM
jgi:hypothetical protein